MHKFPYFCALQVKYCKNDTRYYFSDDWGKLLENLIAAELMKNQKRDGSKVFFWKGPNQEEVDFVIQKGNTIEKLIQVCWNAENAKTRKREIRALLNAWQRLKKGELIVITHDEESREIQSWFGAEKEIWFIPAWKWLLQNS